MDDTIHYDQAHEEIPRLEPSTAPILHSPIKRRWEKRDIITGIAVLIIAVNVLNALFEFQLIIRRKPLLNRMLGSSASNSRGATNSSANGAGSAANGEIIQINEGEIIPIGGIELPVKWGDLGKQLIATGVIDGARFIALYNDLGGLPADMKTLLESTDHGKIQMTPENAGVLLNIFWALGLGTKNPILEKGEMNDPRYGGAGGFASTGGWSMAKGDSMSHYSKHNFIPLTNEQQELVERVSKGIYRPCCGNSVHFPDCNHGMAMLGLLELMAKNGVGEDEMYKVALTVNAYWFPDTYITIAKYLKKQGVAWSTASPKDLLGPAMSSAQGFRQIQSQVEPQQNRGGGGCGV